MQFAQIFLATSAEESAVANGLDAGILNRETTVRVLDVVGDHDGLFADLEKFEVVAAMRAFHPRGELELGGGEWVAAPQFARCASHGLCAGREFWECSMARLGLFLRSGADPWWPL